MMKFNTGITRPVFALSAMFLSALLYAEPYSVNDCQVFELATQNSVEKAEYTDALLWKIQKDNKAPSYLFGTIHVSDPEIVNLPGPVSKKLDNAKIFVMEALPLPEEAREFTRMMFFSDGRFLTNYLDDKLFNKAVDILGKYNMPLELVVMMKPWAAFLIMNYPPGDGLPLDLRLYNRAMENGARLFALETLTEQGNLFGDMDIQDQMKLLLGTLCNYQLVKEEFEIMKSLYIKRDLQGLMNAGNKYSISDRRLYEDLMKKLLWDRNISMVDKMETYLQAGNSFIAIGALHLPGEDGVLSLLHKKGYKISKVY